MADEHGVGIVLDTPTWRANADWGALLGYSPARLDGVNRRAVEFLEVVRADADIALPEPQRRGRMLRHRRAPHRGDLLLLCALVRSVRELAKLSADEERRLLADVHGVIADPFQAA